MILRHEVVHLRHQPMALREELMMQLSGRARRENLFAAFNLCGIKQANRRRKAVETLNTLNGLIRLRSTGVRQC